MCKEIENERNRGQNKLGILTGIDKEKIFWMYTYVNSCQIIHFMCHMLYVSYTLINL